MKGQSFNSPVDADCWRAHTPSPCKSQLSLLTVKCWESAWYRGESQQVFSCYVINVDFCHRQSWLVDNSVYTANIYKTVLSFECWQCELAISVFQKFCLWNFQMNSVNWGWRYHCVKVGQQLLNLTVHRNFSSFINILSIITVCFYSCSVLQVILVSLLHFIHFLHWY